MGAALAQGTGKQMDSLRKILTKFGIGDDLDWLALILFARNMVSHMAIFSPDQKKRLQDYIFEELAKKDFSNKHFIAVLRGFETMVRDYADTLQMRRQLEEERAVSGTLMQELQTILEELRDANTRKEDTWNRFGQETIEAVERDEGKEAIVGRVRGMLTEVFQELRDEAAHWENRARDLEADVNHDPLLTELYNRRALDEYLGRAVPYHAESGKPLCLMMIDVDHFKRINDTYGHLVGDDVLRALASIIRKQALEADGFVARYGGEELVVAVEDIDLEQVFVMAEDMRRSVEGYHFAARPEDEDGGELSIIHFTVSIGLAQLQPDWGVKDLIQAADAALYKAKDLGRNQVIRST